MLPARSRERVVAGPMGLPYDGNGDPAAMGCGAMLPEIEALPCPQVAGVVGDRERDRVLGEDGSNVGGHVVGALGGVAELGRAVGDETGEITLEVVADAGVGVLAEDQGGAGVMEEGRAEALAHPAV